jgi:hypothetical protein
MNSIPAQFTQYIRRKQVVEQYLSMHFHLGRIVLPNRIYLVQDIVQTAFSINLTVEETMSYVHGLVIAKKAIWLYQNAAENFFVQLGAAPLLPSTNTPFQLL